MAVAGGERSTCGNDVVLLLEAFDGGFGEGAIVAGDETFGVERWVFGKKGLESRDLAPFASLS